MGTETGYSLAPARVTGYGSAQSFSSTVTIDAGTDSGLRPDMAVLNGDGLVGRILEVTSHTATVLLIVDPDSTVGGRVGTNMENGFVDGKGGLADDDPLELRLLDNTVTPQRGDAVVTWGSDGAGPYVAGVPIGEVSKVFQDLRAGTYRAVLEPYVDFTSLDLVGVVVPSGRRRRDRAGSIRMRGTQRLVAALITIVTALLLQVTVLPHFAWNGVVPDLVLLAVVGAALVTDPRFATLLGFGAGLLLDLAPPADHAAGRWTLALLAVGYVVGRLAHDGLSGQSGQSGQPGGRRPSYAPDDRCRCRRRLRRHLGLRPHRAPPAGPGGRRRPAARGRARRRRVRRPGGAGRRAPRRPGSSPASPARGRPRSLLACPGGRLSDGRVHPELLAPQPAAADRHPGPRLLVARDARRAPLLPAGGDGGGVPGQGRLPVRARHRRATAARPDRRRRGPPAGHQPAHLGRFDRPHPGRPDGAESCGTRCSSGSPG